MARFAPVLCAPELVRLSFCSVLRRHMFYVECVAVAAHSVDLRWTGANCCSGLDSNLVTVVMLVAFAGFR